MPDPGRSLSSSSSGSGGDTSISTSPKQNGGGDGGGRMLGLDFVVFLPFGVGGGVGSMTGEGGSVAICSRNFLRSRKSPSTDSVSGGQR